MADVYLYTSQYCPYCIRAKYVLEAKGQPFREISVDGKLDVRQEMTNKAKRTSVPQIWINGQHIGGFDDLSRLDISGKLDQLLSH